MLLDSSAFYLLNCSMETLSMSKSSPLQLIIVSITTRYSKVVRPPRLQLLLLVTALHLKKRGIRHFSPPWTRLRRARKTTYKKKFIGPVVFASNQQELLKAVVLFLQLKAITITSKTKGFTLLEAYINRELATVEYISCVSFYTLIFYLYSFRVF